MLQQFLEENKESIIENWIESTISTYKPEMIRFLHKEKNQFANPVRNTIVSSTEKIFNAIVEDIDFDENYPGLEDIIKLRAVQDFSPSNALTFLFFLKKIVRDELQKKNLFNNMSEELIDFENKVDQLMAVAFDIYSNCRKKIYEIRLAELKAQSKRAFTLLEKRNLK